MTTTTSAATTRSWIPRGLGALMASEARIFWRSPGDVFFSLVFPAVLLVGVGYAIPGMREPINEPGWAFDGLPAIAIYAPTVLAVAAAGAAVLTLPATLCGYREQGVLRRLATTPMRPWGVLVAQMAVALSVILAAGALAVAVGYLVFELPAIARPAELVGVFMLAATAALSIGMLIASRAPRAATASGIGTLLYFVMMFFAGMWTPLPTMPDGLRAVAELTPLGAAALAMTSAWLGEAFELKHLLVLIAYPAVLVPLGAKLFRWR